MAYLFVFRDPESSLGHRGEHSCSSCPHLPPRSPSGSLDSLLSGSCLRASLCLLSTVQTSFLSFRENMVVTQPEHEDQNPTKSIQGKWELQACLPLLPASGHRRAAVWNTPLKRIPSLLPVDWLTESPGPVNRVRWLLGWVLGYWKELV